LELERVAIEQIQNGEITDAAAVRHIVKVLRMRPGAEFLAYDGESEFRLRLLSVRKESLAVETIEETSLDPGGDITVAQCIIKGRGWDVFLEKMCEVGAARILPVVSARTVVRPDESEEYPQLDRWRKAARAAAAQCAGRAPDIRPPMTFRQALDLLAPVKYKYVLCFSAEAPLAGVLPADDAGGIALLLGPEGDLSPEETLAAERAGFRPAHLGPRILRSETAAISAAVMALNAAGALKNGPAHGR